MAGLLSHVRAWLAHRDLVDGINGDNRRTSREVGIGDHHARAETQGRADGDHGGVRIDGAARVARVAGGVVENDQVTDAAGFRSASGQDTTGGKGADARVKSVVAAQEAAVLEVEHIRSACEKDVVGSIASDLEETRGSVAC